ncbi:MAG: hypothetical protein A3D65_03020 [Candidatus Lloydbacteria bacterium RIFCSPHIGHO2_02_FULL_50_13]|uniref:Uncharacterized protein n=1 Tax=Candidatus Lloydbacteria bacterium RIFCSPHIGHO2_02_FULL_50_13 TaxID=1798661 RepID=A0A1G2D4C3_9BACT|nr:MAG: hypothetical protein A3D65_03020 [Candidatus Lloydbacteria bacterium RIFCSPHIGHO2_02_FULL_50_13]
MYIVTLLSFLGLFSVGFGSYALYFALGITYEADTSVVNVALNVALGVVPFFGLLYLLLGLGLMLCAWREAKEYLKPKKTAVLRFLL